MHYDSSQKHVVFVTGAAGFLGQYLLRDLLNAGVTCVAMMRQTPADAELRLKNILQSLGVNWQKVRDQNRLTLLHGDINGAIEPLSKIRPTSILHAAGSTRFDRDASGEPTHTNLHGTQRLLDWASENNIRDFHLVSTAYQCGQTDGHVDETVGPHTRPFNNEYERSKYLGEMACADWSRRHEHNRLTIYRPSIVVGDRDNSRTTKYSGFYLYARAIKLLADAVDRTKTSTRPDISIRLCGNDESHQNIVPVDYVSRLITTGLTQAQFHGGVYHLTHPQPPTNALVKKILEDYFDIQGGEFIPPHEFNELELTDLETGFLEASRSITPYLTASPQFDRRQTDRLEAAAGESCPAYTHERLTSLIQYAQKDKWGKASSPKKANADDASLALFDFYFRQYLPAQIAGSSIAKITGLNTTVSFQFEDQPQGEWVCCFDQGLLGSVTGPGNIHPESDFKFITQTDVFWQAIAGRIHPQEVFMTGRARIEGNVEKALKMAVILHAFNKENPCTKPMLIAERSQACQTS